MGQTNQPEGITPVPTGIRGSLSADAQPFISWEAVAGHGPQTGLQTQATFPYEAFAEDYGTEYPNWDFGDPMEVRRASGREDLLCFSSSGFDALYFNEAGGPDGHACVYVYQQADHAPVLALPNILGYGTKAKYDQLHYFNADPSQGAVDMIDLSPLGVTHPDQLTWYPGEGDYQYSYLTINDNDDSDLDIAGAILIRADRLTGTFSLTENIIYAQGQTTYHVYRRRLGDMTYQQIATDLPETSFTDRTVPPGTDNYEYVVTANDLFGESDMSAATSVYASGFPVEWLRFEATSLAVGQVQLQWATASERNNAHFIIERSADAQFFEAIGMTPGSGHSDTVLSYQFVDQQALDQQSYYRLRQVDLDGAEHFSEILTVNPAGTVIPSIQAYPNPAVDQVALQGLLLGHSYDISLLDNRGRQLRRTQLWSEAFAPQLDLAGLPKGIYHVILHNLALDDVQHVQVILQ